MNILAQNEYRTEITLSTQELADYGITYEELDYSNIHTRKFLWEISEYIRKNCGYSIRLSGRILIEAIKESEDSVKICLTSLSHKNSDDHSLKQLIKNQLHPLVAQFSCFELMLEAVSRLDTGTHSSLFEKDGKYRLVLSPDSKNYEGCVLSLCEFSEALQDCPVEAARCSEMWKLISSPFAVYQLTTAFLTH